LVPLLKRAFFHHFNCSIRILIGDLQLQFWQGKVSPVHWLSSPGNNFKITPTEEISEVLTDLCKKIINFENQSNFVKATQYSIVVILFIKFQISHDLVLFGLFIKEKIMFCCPGIKN
jgi:hypothetical protein